MITQSPQHNPSSDPKSVLDLLVVGGGINGAGIARDAAGRGLSVLLVERDDLASHTSSASTKLVHGGLRYLEHYEFGLVRKALREREVLLASAPHIIWPLRFVMPHDPSMRPAWMIRMGLVLYDHLARREVLPGSRRVSLANHASGRPLKPGFSTGFVYSDGWVDDARLVVLNALDAAERGAGIRTRTSFVSARALADHWEATLSTAAGESSTVRARAIVNAAGPWAQELLTGRLQQASPRRLRLIKGSHIVVPRLFDHPYAYIFQSPDKRIVFAIPYEENFTLIGTTDVEHLGDPAAASISTDETVYLCELASRYFRKTVAPADVVWSYSGVRPLLEDEANDPSAVTRDYQLELNGQGPPLLSVWGGKITTFRKLSEEAVDALVARGLRASGPAWTRDARLPGGDLLGTASPAAAPARKRFSTRSPVGGALDFDGFVARMGRRHAWVAPALLRRWARAYGSRLEVLLEGRSSAAALGPEIAPGVYERELEYLHATEWARTGEDVLWRRTKLGLHLGPRQREAVAGWMQARCANTG